MPVFQGRTDPECKKHQISGRGSHRSSSMLRMGKRWNLSCNKTHNMKTITITLFMLLFLLLTGTTNSQSHLKIGHVDIMKILSSLPERNSAQLVLDKEAERNSN